MKIGILTVYSFNYGSYFQATALYRYLEARGYDCELINERFKKKQWGNLRLLYAFHDLLPGILRKAVGKLLPQYVTYLRLQEDVAGYRESDPARLELSELTRDYDLVLLGADELWSASMQSIRYTPEHFGYGIACPHAAYATSGCLFDLDDTRLCERAAEGLGSFDAVAVRDAYTAEVVERLTGKRPPVVLDPTLLYPYFAREDAGEKVPGAPYVLLYGSEYSKAQQAYIRVEAKRLGARICAMGWAQDWAEEFLDPRTAEEFQAYFAGAAYCFPATFHGTIFSILQHRQFVTMGNERRGRKIGLLLEQLGLEGRLYRDGGTYTEIDYDALEARLAELREQSGAWLDGVLERYEKKARGQEILDRLAKRADCTGCGACVSVCPAGALRLAADAEGFAYPAIEAARCVGCGRCERVCPSLSMMSKAQGGLCAAIHRKSAERRRASSGGAFYGLAESVIARGGIVFGAVYTEDFAVAHRGAKTLEELRAMQGSKYVAGQMHPAEPGGAGAEEDCIRAAAEALHAGREVMYSGTPCQIAGVRAALAELSTEEERERLYLVEILCHGVPSPLIWQAYRRMRERERQSAVTSVNFRDKTRGWRHQALELRYADGGRYLAGNEEDPYYILYFAHVMLRPSCHRCRYASRERIADLTLGDYWGNEDAPQPVPESEEGVSLILCNTERGKALLERSTSLERYPGDEKSAYQPLFRAPSRVSKRREAFWEWVRREGAEAAIRRYGRLTLSQRLVKQMIAPLTRWLGIYKLAQRVYFR